MTIQPNPAASVQQARASTRRATVLCGLLVCLLGTCSAGVAATRVWVDTSKYRAGSSIRVTQYGGLLEVVWPGETGARRLRFNLEPRQPLIRDVGAAHGKGFVPILENVTPKYLCFTAKRHGGWNNFFDNPIGRPHEIRTFDASLDFGEVQVTSDHERVRVTFGGFKAGIFAGRLVFTFFAGSNLIQQEAVVSTTEPDVAYYYDAWLGDVSTRNVTSLNWTDTDGRLQRYVVEDGLHYFPQVLKVRGRTLVAEGANGSIGVFPPPHKFFFARDETMNFGYVWHRTDSIREDDALLSFGIRQDPEGWVDESAPLYNAPPGTEQRLAVFYYVDDKPAKETLQGVAKFTHNDSFKALPGFQTFTSHWHMRVAASALIQQDKNYVPEFKPMFKQMGVKMVHLAEFHGDGHPYTRSEKRLKELEAQYSECRRLSDPDFVLIPGEEGNVFLGGHWNLIFPRPVYWFWDRLEGQEFRDRRAPYGDVFHLGNAEDTHRLITEQGGLMWQAHPRSKGSVGYPDKIADQAYYKDARWIGAAFKDMPSDLSSPRLGERALDLLDDMNNWGGRRFLVGEIDIFKVDRTHELYGHMNINYLRMDKLPVYPDWSSVLDVLSRGDFFVTSGEVLIKDFTVGGKRSGQSVPLDTAGPVEVVADLEWTFPLHIVELVWGDGKETHRQIVTASDTAAMSERSFRFTRDLKGVKWIRFAAWDVAGNGAFTQPVYVGPVSASATASGER